MKNIKGLYLSAAAISLAIAVSLAYVPSFKAGWQYDDFNQIVNNKAVHIDSFSPSSLYRAAFQSPLETRPLSNATFALDYLRGGLEPGIYHQLNLILHIGASLLAALLLLLIFRLPIMEVEHPIPAALLGAAVFALNPIQTQSVTYIVQRMNLLSGVFSLAALILLTIWNRSGLDKRARVAAIGLALVAFFLALASKENAFSILLLAPAIDFCSHRGGFKDWLIARKIYIAIFVSAAIALSIYFVISGGVFDAYETRDFTMGERLLTQPRALIYYIAIWLVPAGSRLSFDHNFATSTGLFSPWTTTPAILIIVGSTAAALAYSRRAPLLCLGWLWFICGLALESSVLPLEMVFEHRLYIPSIGLIMMAVDFIGRAGVGWKALPPVLIGILLMGMMTFERNKTWADSMALWKDEARKSPGSVRPWINLCGGAYMAGDDANAIRWCGLAGRRDNNNPALWHNMGLALFRQGRYRESEEALIRAVKLSPAAHSSIYQLAMVFFMLGENARAEKAFARAVELDGANPVYWYQLGRVQAAQMKTITARRTLKTALKLSTPANGELAADIRAALAEIENR